MTTISMSDFNLSPEIILGNAEHRQLTMLATANTGHAADAADWLLSELDRAKIVSDDLVPRDVVRMGSSVRFRTNGSEKTVQLVFPKDADIHAGRISVLAPIGTALIGLRAGQSITWLTRGGQKHVLTVIEVRPPLRDDEPEPPAAA